MNTSGSTPCMLVRIRKRSAARWIGFIHWMQGKVTTRTWLCGQRRRVIQPLRSRPIFPRTLEAKVRDLTVREGIQNPYYVRLSESAAEQAELKWCGVTILFQISSVHHLICDLQEQRANAALDKQRQLLQRRTRDSARLCSTGTQRTMQ